MKNRLPRIAMFAVALVVAAAAYVALLPANQAIFIGGPHACTYYSSKQYKTVIGACSQGCCSNVTTCWGTTSVYVRCEVLYCPAVVCPD